MRGLILCVPDPQGLAQLLPRAGEAWSGSWRVNSRMRSSLGIFTGRVKWGFADSTWDFWTVLSPPAERKGRAQCTGSSQVGWFRNQAPWPAWVLVHLPNSFRKHTSESFTGDFVNMFYMVWFDRTPQVINVCVNWTHCSQRGPGSSFP